MTVPLGAPLLTKTTPAAGATVTGSAVTFTWTAVAGRATAGVRSAVGFLAPASGAPKAPLRICARSWSATAAAAVLPSTRRPVWRSS